MGRVYAMSTIKRYRALERKGKVCRGTDRLCIRKAKWLLSEIALGDGKLVQIPVCNYHYRQIVKSLHHGCFGSNFCLLSAEPIE